MSIDATKEVKLAVWKWTGGSEATLWTTLIAARGDWVAYTTDAESDPLKVRTLRGDPLWEVFHFDEVVAPQPVGTITLGVPFWVSLRVEKKSLKESFPPEAERKAFSAVAVGKPENEGELK